MIGLSHAQSRSSEHCSKATPQRLAWRSQIARNTALSMHATNDMQTTAHAPGVPSKTIRVKRSGTKRQADPATTSRSHDLCAALKEPTASHTALHHERKQHTATVESKRRANAKPCQQQLECAHAHLPQAAARVATAEGHTGSNAAAVRASIGLRVVVCSMWLWRPAAAAERSQHHGALRTRRRHVSVSARFLKRSLRR